MALGVPQILKEDIRQEERQLGTFVAITADLNSLSTEDVGSHVPATQRNLRRWSQPAGTQKPSFLNQEQKKDRGTPEIGESLLRTQSSRDALIPAALPFCAPPTHNVCTPNPYWGLSYFQLCICDLQLKQFCLQSFLVSLFFKNTHNECFIF